MCRWGSGERERERERQHTSGENWAHLLWSTQPGKKTLQSRHTFINTSTHRHTNSSTTSPEHFSGVPAQRLERLSANRGEVLLAVACLKWSAALSLRGDAARCTYHLKPHCGSPEATCRGAWCLWNRHKTIRFSSSSPLTGLWTKCSLRDCCEPKSSSSLLWYFNNWK